MLVRSDDDGVTWSEPINITSQVKKPEWCFILQGPGKGITMQDGTIVFAAQYQDPPDKKRLPHSTIIYSKDHGRTWQVIWRVRRYHGISGGGNRTGRFDAELPPQLKGTRL